MSRVFFMKSRNAIMALENSKSGDSIICPESQNAGRWSTGRCLLFCCVLVILIGIVYGQVVRNQFVSYDDAKYVNDSIVRSGLSFNGIWRAFTTPLDANWIPLTWLSHMIDFELFGTSPIGPHLVNVALHIVNTLLLWGLLRRITGAEARSAV